MSNVDNPLYPLFVRMSAHRIEELRECELGSWEDRTDDEPAQFGTTHVYDILGRHRHKIEMRDADEVAEIYYAAISGTFQIDRTDEGGDDRQFRAACRLCDKLRPVLRAGGDTYAQLLGAWRAPCGM